MHVVLLPGQGHERHNHPDADEILYVLAGAGDQMVDDGDPFAGAAGPGDLDPEGRVPLDAQHGVGADGAARRVCAGGGGAGVEDAARLRGGPGGAGAAPGSRVVGSFFVCFVRRGAGVGGRRGR